MFEAPQSGKQGRSGCKAKLLKGLLKYFVHIIIKYRNQDVVFFKLHICRVNLFGTFKVLHVLALKIVSETPSIRNNNKILVY